MSASSDLIANWTSSFDAIWNDQGSGATRNGGFWHPKIEGVLRPVGSIGVPNYYDVNGNYFAQLIGVNPNSSSSKPAVASPVDYVVIWTDKESGADHDGSIWRPVPPSGYKSAGDVAQKGWSKPDINRVWCVRDDLLVNGNYESESVWDDKESGASNNVSIWEIQRSSRGLEGDILVAQSIGAFRANRAYSAPDSSYASVVKREDRP